MILTLIKFKMKKSMIQILHIVKISKHKIKIL